MTDAELAAIRDRMHEYRVRYASDVIADLSNLLYEVDRLRAYQRLPKGTLGLPPECTDPKEYD